MDKKTENRYFDYILIYINTILELSPILEKRCEKQKSGDIIIDRKKYMYFTTTSWVTIVNKRSNLELTFPFNKEKDSISFKKDDLNNFIESDLNTSGLWKNFPPNKIIRTRLYDECLDNILLSGKIQKKDKWFIISKEELY